MWSKLTHQIDRLLNQITMYRLVLYLLFVLLIAALGFSYFNLLPFSPLALIFSTILIIFVCYLTNLIFAKVYQAQTNIESVYITALILALIASPPKTMADLSFLVWISILSMASKYILAINKKHLINPVAIAAVVIALSTNQSASWWVGNSLLMPFVVVSGLLIARKLQRSDLVFYFCETAVFVSCVLALLNGTSLTSTLIQIFFHSSLFFFAFYMLTEPLTSPPTRLLQILYGIFVGILFIPKLHLGPIYSTPEIALVIGNLFSYLVSPKDKLMLILKEKLYLGDNLYDFTFSLDQPFNFISGQYLEFTLTHDHPDSRGNRRYFTIASSPTESQLRIGAKFYQPSSSFKEAMLAMTSGDTIVASQLAGDFILPKNKMGKLVFLAGGIGITPFRSMIKSLIDKNETRDIVLFYSNKNINEVIYTDVFDEAEKLHLLKTIYTLTDLSKIPSAWSGEKGRINAEMITKFVPDYQNRRFYISGTHEMVTHTQKLLTEMGINPKNIRSDFFPGFV